MPIGKKSIDVEVHAVIETACLVEVVCYAHKMFIKLVVKK